MKNTDVGAGVIDTDYRGNVRVLILNHSAEKFDIEAADCTAQFVLTRFKQPDIVEGSDLEQTICASNGLGGSGVQLFFNFIKNLLIMLHVSDRYIKNFMDICHNGNGFVLPAVHFCYVCCTVTEEMINEILKNNAIKNFNSFETTKCFDEFLLRFKTAVGSILGGSFSVQVFHSFALYRRLVVHRKCYNR